MPLSVSEKSPGFSLPFFFMFFEGLSPRSGAPMLIGPPFRTFRPLCSFRRRVIRGFVKRFKPALYLIVFYAWYSGSRPLISFALLPFSFSPSSRKQSRAAPRSPNCRLIEWPPTPLPPDGCRQVDPLLRAQGFPSRCGDEEFSNACWRFRYPPSSGGEIHPIMRHLS